MMFSALGQAVLIIRQCFGFFSVAVSPVCALGGLLPVSMLHSSLTTKSQTFGTSGNVLLDSESEDSIKYGCPNRFRSVLSLKRPGCTLTNKAAD